MKKAAVLVLAFLAVSCTEIIDKPKHLISEEKMAALIAELAVSDQLSMVAPSYNPEAQTRFVLKKEKVDAQQFYDSYKYYTATKKIAQIYDEAQEKIKNRDPKARIFIEKKIKEQDSAKVAEETRLKQNPK